MHSQATSCRCLVRAFVTQARPPRFQTLDQLCDGVEETGGSRSIRTGLGATFPLRARRKQFKEIVKCSSRFPWTNTFELDGNVFEPAILPLLLSSILPERVEVFRSVAKKRIFSILPILEGLVDYDNIGAVLRSSEAFGIGSVWAVGGNRVRSLSTSRCSAGAEKWVDTQVFRSSLACLSAAKQAGFRIAVADIGPQAVPISDLDWDATPTAFVLGNEGHGISEQARQMADIQIMVPMSGLVESFNVSVAAACIMQTATNKIRQSEDRLLSVEERDILLTIMALKQNDFAGEMVRQLIDRKARGEFPESSIRGFLGGF